MGKTLTESEKIEQLMRPRFRVIADWPQRQYWEVGDIITLDSEDKPTYLFKQRESDGMQVYPDYFERFPHLFKRLEWWEERTPEEMPEYVRDEVTGKILRIEYRIDSHTPCEVKTWNEFEKPFWNILQDLLPATEAEYKEYLTHSQAGER